MVFQDAVGSLNPRMTVRQTLEEPPSKAVFLLLTDAPEQLLPTIVSRCQRIDLPDAHEHQLGDPWRTNVLGVLSDPGLADVTAAGIVKKAAAAAVAKRTGGGNSRLRQDGLERGCGQCMEIAETKRDFHFDS